MLVLLAIILLTGYLAYLVITHPIKTIKYVGFFVLILALGLLVWAALIGGLVYVTA